MHDHIKFYFTSLPRFAGIHEAKRSKKFAFRVWVVSAGLKC